MQNPFVYLINTLLDLYILAVLMRFLLTLGRPDPRNPLLFTLGKLTNPLVLPTRRFVPAIGGIDTATLVVLLLLQILASALLINMTCIGDVMIGQIVIFGLVRLLELVLTLYFWLLIAYVVVSWIRPGEAFNPALAIIAAIVEPALAPLRRFIPAVGGLDLSPIFAFIAIGFFQRLIPPAEQVAGIVCVPV
jgi:YggT family protein